MPSSLPLPFASTIIQPHSVIPLVPVRRPDASLSHPGAYTHPACLTFVLTGQPLVCIPPLPKITDPSHSPACLFPPRQQRWQAVTWLWLPLPPLFRSLDCVLLILVLFVASRLFLRLFLSLSSSSLSVGLFFCVCSRLRGLLAHHLGHHRARLRHLIRPCTITFTMNHAEDTNQPSCTCIKWKRGGARRGVILKRAERM